MHSNQIIIYNASAGSGKTYTLAKEYLKIILSSKVNDAYKSILAITFTNKAVHEMKSRVLNNLSYFTQENPDEKTQNLMNEISLEIGLSTLEIKQKAKNIIKNLIHNYAAFDISTIDKFTHRVIRAFAHDLGLPINFEVSLETEELLSEAVDTLIAQAGNDKELTSLLVDYSIEKTNDDKSWDITKELINTGKLILNENDREEIKSFNDKSISEFLEIKNKLLNYCQSLKNQSKDYSNLALKLIENKDIEYSSFYSSYVPNHFLKLSSGAIEKNIKHYKYLDNNEKKRYSAKTPQNQKDSIDEIADELFNILKKINDTAEKYFFYEAFLKTITPLSLLNKLNQEINQIQEDQNLLSISEFNKLIFEQIQNQPAPFIYERLGEKYRHFFIDEFQDTSIVQWHNLIPLIDNALVSENLQGQRGSLMLVGDPKQSIYRWRGGKAEQFIELTKNENPFGIKEKLVQNLPKNYRSTSNIIAFNNQFFSYLSTKFSNQKYKDLYLESPQEINNKFGGYVSILFLNKNEKQEFNVNEENDDNEEIKEELSKIELYFKPLLSKINELKALGYSNKDIAILTRTKYPGVETARFLTENNIPVLSSESLLLSSSSEVKFIIHILRYVKDKNNLDAKANFLYYLANNLNNISENKVLIHDFIYEGNSIKEELQFITWLTKFNIDLDFKKLRKKPLYEMVEIIISNCIAPQNKTAYVQFFLDLVLERDIKNQSGISDFLNHWDKKSDSLSITSPEENDAIKIMTIHKSKGLEFPVVIFPFADQDYNKNNKDSIWIDINEEELGLPKALVKKNSNVKDFGNKANQTYLEKTQEDLLDNINVLYVALTRAEEQLHIITQQVSKKRDGSYPNNTATFFTEYLEQIGLYSEDKMYYEFGENKKYNQENETNSQIKTIPQITNYFKPENIKIAQRESLMWNTKQQKAIEYGNLLHEVLSFIENKDQINLAITIAQEKGLIKKSETESIFKAISNIVNHPELIEFYSSGNKTISERTIIQKDGPIVKPDRIVINNNNEVYLLDYKTGDHLSKHKSQIQNYQYALENMGYKVVKKALVYIADTIEIVNL